MLDLNEEVLAVAHQWAAKAENDLRTAAHALRLKTNCPTDTVCFHAQQCSEPNPEALTEDRPISVSDEIEEQSVDTTVGHARLNIYLDDLTLRTKIRIACASSNARQSAYCRKAIRRQ